MKPDEYNEAKKQIYDLCELLGAKKWIEIKVRCLFCGECAMLLKEKGLHYYCLACGAEGDLEELERIILEREMQKYSRLHLGT